MGAMFSAPKPMPIEPADSGASPDRSGAAADEAARAARIRAVERARRGLAGTIVTSARGVLAAAPAFAARKSLLGE